MNKTTGRVGAIVSFGITMMLSASAHAEAVIYEPFSQPAGPLNGATGGTGLNNWSSNSPVSVVDPATLIYGDLQNAGGQADAVNNPGADGWVTTTSVLGNNNLLDDGATLWFSTMFMKTSGGGSNEWAGFALGTERLDAAFNGVNMTNSGNGIGFATRNAGVNVATWLGGGNASQGGGHAITFSTPVLIVGKIEWGVTAGDDETITLYIPSTTDLATQGTGVSKTVTGFDQTALDTVSFTQRNSGGTYSFDEIRFGATYEDVTPAGSGAVGTLLLTITPNSGTAGNYDFSWDSQAGKVYDLVSKTDLSTAPSTWPVWDSRTNIPSGGTSTSLTDVPGGGDAQRFFAVIEKDPPPLFSETFDAAGPALPLGWVAVNASTVWDVGDPSSLASLQDDDGTNCVGTNVVAGDYADEVATLTLTSPAVPIPAGGATLTFRQYIDSDAGNGDVGAVRLLDATDTEIVEGDFPVTGIDGVETGWTDESFALPPSAAGQNVKVVFEFVTAADGTVYKGFYVDDVVISAN